MSWQALAAATLENDDVLLRPIEPGDHASLHAIAMDEAIWRHFVTAVRTDADFDALFDAMCEDHAAGRRAVFHITDKRSGRTAGSMSFGNMSERDARIEIGWSWLGREFRGRDVNRPAKLLLLEHAFERLGAERVEFKTDERNEQARRGLRNIGATEEGILRSYNVMPGGRRRDAVFFSILRSEWPAVKRRLATTPQHVRAGVPS